MTHKTGRDLCLAAQQRLEAAGIENARRDVSLLFLFALGQAGGSEVKRHHLAQHMNCAVSAGAEAAFQRAVDARSARQPVSQIIGMRAFWNHDFIVTPDTLTPRPETETLVEAALKLPWQSVLDMGTGTGAILISLLAARPGSSGTGTDISDAALDVARANADRTEVAAQWLRADWFDGLTGRFDLIVSNPPYIAPDEMAGLEPEIREWEPHPALTDGVDGLSAYRAIAAGAGNHLTPGGQVLVETGWQQGAAVMDVFHRHGAKTRLITDLAGRDRVIFAQFSS